ncbi:MAG: GNAT family N-acetyltransferase [Myxococcales bacterium]|nr:MAG: GNAT family N-acetyltransferase [Myxococcales bacterium]
MGEVVGERVLSAGDEAQLFAFLEPHLDSSLFLISNAEKAGLVDHGEPLQGTYVASFDSRGRMTAVAAHFWNGNVMLQGDAGLEQAARRACEVSGRNIRGFIGPWALVCRARQAFGLADEPASHDGQEALYALALEELQLPSSLQRGDAVLRPPTEAEVREVLGGWRADYHVECLGAERKTDLVERALQETQRWVAVGTLWVLTVAGELVAMTGFNSETRGNVQVGGVFTPPALRGRGYARAAVAASLQLARAERGAVRSILFTSKTNTPARRAYESLGYRVVGDFGLVLF